jgi:hypothetical protein
VEVNRVLGKFNVKQSDKKKILKTLNMKNASIEAAELFKKFQKIEFQQQHRVEGHDNIQINLVNSFRKLTATPVLTEDSISSIMDIDSTTNDLSWIIAPVVAVTNEERQNCNSIRARIFAQALRKPVIRYELPLKLTSLQKLSPEEIRDIYESNVEPWGYFIPLAPAYLTENFNVSDGYANGTIVVQHSFTYSDKMSKEDILRFEKLYNDISNIGKILTLPFPPATITCYKANDEDHPFSLISKNTAFIAEDYLATKRELITVNTTGAGVQNRTKSFKAKVGNYYLKDLLEYINYGIELKFGVTFHKVQGLTVPKIILQLNYMPGLGSLDFHSLYVAMTRTKENSHIQKIPIVDNDYRHLLNIVCPLWLFIFMKMYDDNGYWIIDDATLKHLVVDYNDALYKAKQKAAQYGKTPKTISTRKTILNKSNEWSRNRMEISGHDLQKFDKIPTYPICGNLIPYDQNSIFYGFVWANNSCCRDTLCTGLIHCFLQLSQNKQTELCCNDDSKFFETLSNYLTKELSFQEIFKRFNYLLIEETNYVTVNRGVDEVYSDLFICKRNCLRHNQDQLLNQLKGNRYFMDCCQLFQYKCSLCHLQDSVVIASPGLHGNLPFTGHFKNSVQEYFSEYNNLGLDGHFQINCSNINCTLHDFPYELSDSNDWVKRTYLNLPPVICFSLNGNQVNVQEYYYNNFIVNRKLIISDIKYSDLNQNSLKRYRVGACIFYNEGGVAMKANCGHYTAHIWSHGKWFVYDGMKEEGRFQLYHGNHPLEVLEDCPINVLQNEAPQGYSSLAAVIYFECSPDEEKSLIVKQTNLESCDNAVLLEVKNHGNYSIGTPIKKHIKSDVFEIPDAILNSSSDVNPSLKDIVLSEEQNHAIEWLFERFEEWKTLQQFDSIQLTTLMKKHIRILWSLPDNAESLLFECEIFFHQILTLSNLKKLKPTSWLSTNTLEAFINIINYQLKKTNRNHKIYDIFLLQFISQIDTATGKYTRNDSKIHHWIDREKRKSSERSEKMEDEKWKFTDYDLCLFPVNVNNNHFILFTYEYNSNKFSFYDSLENIPGEATSTVYKILKQCLVLSCNFSERESNTVHLVNGGSPQQNNTYDCGVYLARNMELIAFGNPLNYSSSDIETIRYIMTLKLLLAKCNPSE